ncbi:nitrous oxide reductase accessory protein NosL [Maliponia aquimaris]|uniref:NosL n=1 Tax=Maliponia aquimaris TaxID=1673631 RepID=A0A238L2M9_9RHOB|nr:nitrous oxide reductase accessory protein NosL [Maliponia aquimaris]SMX49333.1 NosL [Maliponia aquimaris]
MTRLIVLALLALALGACKKEVAERPLPVSMTAEAVGHYCQMDLLEHPGPKAQVHLDGLPDPLFFSQVRDAIAYQRMPEQSHAIAAIYVSDMGVAPSWQSPGADNWIAAESAVFVVGASINGGMGAPELVPFADRSAAEAFVADNGGEILSLAAVPDDTVLTPVEFELDAEGNFIPPEGAVID